MSLRRIPEEEADCRSTRCQSLVYRGRTYGIDTVVIDAHDADTVFALEKRLEGLELVPLGGGIRCEPGQPVLFPLALGHLLGVAALVVLLPGAERAGGRPAPRRRGELGRLHRAPGDRRELGVLGEEDMALGGLGRAYGEGLFQLAGGGAFAEGGGHGRRGEVPEMGGEGGEGGALPEGGGRSRQSCGCQRGAGGDSWGERGRGGERERDSPGTVPGFRLGMFCGGVAPCGLAVPARGAACGRDMGNVDYGVWRMAYGMWIRNMRGKAPRRHPSLSLPPHLPSPSTMAYVAVAKALYDYQPQDPDTELAFHEDHILYIIDKEDDE